MYEPAVALTDFVLTLECAVLFVLLRRGAKSPLRSAFLSMFAATAVAALLGRLVHAFLPDETTLAYGIAWRATLLIIGAAAVSAFLAGAYLLFPAERVPLLRKIAAGSYLAYLLWLFFVSMKFRVAIAYYLPATVLLLIAFLVVRRRREGAMIGAVGVLLTLIAAAIQQARIGIHPVYFNHDAVYHVVEMVALWLLFLGARGVSSEQSS